MRRALPLLAAVALITILLSVFAATTALDYYKAKSSSELNILLFTEKDNLYTALKLLNDRGAGAIIVIDAAADKAYIIWESVGNWDFEVYMQTAGSRESFELLDCAGPMAGDYTVPDLKQAAGSEIRLPEILANCSRDWGAAAITLAGYPNLKTELTEYASEIRNVYGVPANTITLEGGTVPTGEPKAVIEADKTTGAFPLAVKFGISKSTASAGQQLEKYELDFGDGTAKATGNWPATATIDHTYSKAATATFKVFEKTTGKTATAAVAIGGTAISSDCATCNTIALCLACLDQQLVSGIFR